MLTEEEFVNTNRIATGFPSSVSIEFLTSSFYLRRREMCSRGRGTGKRERRYSGKEFARIGKLPEGTPLNSCGETDVPASLELFVLQMCSFWSTSRSQHAAM
jgi:hypothetical protein